MWLFGPRRPRNDVEHELVAAWDAQAEARLGRPPTDDDRDAAMSDGTHPLSRRSRFARGEDPLPAYSSIPPRSTGWERDYQRGG